MTRDRITREASTGFPRTQRPPLFNRQVARPARRWGAGSTAFRALTSPRFLPCGAEVDIRGYVSTRIVRPLRETRVTGPEATVLTLSTFQPQSSCPCLLRTRRARAKLVGHRGACKE